MADTFEIEFTGHEISARKLLIEKNLVKTEKLALMCDFDVEEIINDNFVVFKVGEDWMLIPNDKADEILKQIIWIER